MRKVLQLLIVTISLAFTLFTIPTTTYAQSCLDFGEGDCRCNCAHPKNDSCNLDSPPNCGTNGTCECGSASSVGSDPTCGSGGIDTALGCIPVQDTNEFAAWIARWGAGVGGGIAIMLIAYASFQIMTSGGDPGKIQAGKGLLTAAISGLLFLLLGAYALNILGIQILGIPGLT